MIGLNYIEAAKKLLQIENRILTSSDEKYLSEQASAFLKNLQNLTKEKNWEYELANMLHTVVVPLVKNKMPELSTKKIQKRLAAVKDFCNFDHETISIATKVDIQSPQGGKKSYLQVDVPMCGYLDPQLATS